MVLMGEAYEEGLRTCRGALPLSCACPDRMKTLESATQRAIKKVILNFNIFASSGYAWSTRVNSPVVFRYAPLGESVCFQSIRTDQIDSITSSGSKVPGAAV
jgi:hypothetical protein